MPFSLFWVWFKVRQNSSKSQKKGYPGYPYLKMVTGVPRGLWVAKARVTVEGLGV